MYSEGESLQKKKIWFSYILLWVFVILLMKKIVWWNSNSTHDKPDRALEVIEDLTIVRNNKSGSERVELKEDM